MTPDAASGGPPCPAILVAGLLMALSALVQVLDSVIVRIFAADRHPFVIVFFRNLFGLVLLTPLMRRPDLSLRGRGLWLAHGSRAVLKIVAMTSSFFAITLLPLSTFTAPLFAMLGAVLLGGAIIILALGLILRSERAHPG